MIASVFVLFYLAIISGTLGLLGIQSLSALHPFQDTNHKVHFSLIFLVGLSILSFLTTLLSLVMKISLGFHLLLILLAILYMGMQRRRISSILTNFWVGEIRNPPLILVLLSVMVTLLLKAAQGATDVDTGLYHAQTIQWIENYAVVPGLGNLHGRLAFNSSLYLLSAVTALSFLRVGTFYPVNIFIFLMGCLFFTYKAADFRTKKTASNASALLLLFFTVFYLIGAVGSPVTDIPCSLLVWVIFLLFLEKFETGTLEIWDLRSWVIVLLAVWMFTIKISVVPVLLIPLYLCIRSFKSQYTVVIKAALIGIVLLLPWIVRNVILSGYLVYPVPFLAIPGLDWKVPVSVAQNEQEWILSWARVAKEPKAIVLAMPFETWAAKWIENQEQFNLVMLLSAVLGSFFRLSFHVFRLLQNKLTSYQHAFYGAVYVVLLIAVSYWFFLAPDFRFGLGFIVMGFAIPFVQNFQRIAHSAFFSILVSTATLMIALLFMVLLLKTPDIISCVWFPKRPVEAQVEMVKIDHGVTLYYPVKSDKCWEHALPCTPHIVDNLQLRGTDLQDGFRVLGDAP